MIVVYMYCAFLVMKNQTIEEKKEKLDSTPSMLCTEQNSGTSDHEFKTGTVTTEYVHHPVHHHHLDDATK
jgi:hypothetical protein